MVRITDDARLTATEARYQDLGERKQWYAWSTQRIFNAMRAEENAYNPKSVDDVIRHFMETNFLNMAQIARLDMWMQKADYFPSMPMGWCNGELYELRPQVDILQPTKSTPSLHNQFPLVDVPGILGCNTNVEPVPIMKGRARRNQNISEESTKSTKSDDYEPSRPNEIKVFQQLGNLWQYCGDCSKRGTSADNGSWEDTDYVVVTEISQGRPGTVWVIYNFWRFDEDTRERYHYEDDTVPVFPSGNYDDYIACARIGPSLEGWRFSDAANNTFDLSCMTAHEPELVHVRQLSTNFLVPETIEKSYR